MSIFLFVIVYLIVGRLYWFFYSGHLMKGREDQIQKNDEYYCTLIWPVGVIAFFHGLVEGMIDGIKDRKEEEKR